jgi:hypothetical protein
MSPAKAVPFAQTDENGGMASDDAGKQELLQAFHDAVKKYWHSRDAVGQTADFGAPGGDGEKQHRKADAAHKTDTAVLKQLLAKAHERGDVDDVELAKAATISPLELKTIRRELQATA